MRRARWKRKNVRDDLTPLCQITRNGGCPSRTADQIWKSPTGCADRYSSNNCVLAFGGTAFIGVQRGHPLPPFPLPLPLSLEGFPKGRNRSFAPLCRFKGVRGEIEIPPRFSLGGRGDILFSKENIPLASPYRTGTVPPGPPVIFSARRKENGDSIRCGIAAHLRTNLVRLISQKKSSAFCGEPPPHYGSSRISGILMHRGPPRPRLSSALGMAWMRMPASSKERLVTWFRV